MRRRLVAALVGLTVAVIALYGVPRAFFLHDFVESNARDGVERSAGYAATAYDRARAAGQPVDPTLFDDVVGAGETVLYTAPDGTSTVLGGSGAPGAGITGTHEVADGGTVTVAVAAEVVSDQYLATLLPLVFLGVALVPVAALLGLLLARRLSRPFTDLAEVAREMGTGRFDLDVPHHRIPEAEAIGRALSHSAARLDTLVRRERALASHASHELRTPITAVRLTLEDLALWPQTDPLVAEELDRVVAEVDRLSSAVSGLLEESRSTRMQGVEPVDLGAVVSGCLAEWVPVADTVGLTLHRDPSPLGLLIQLPIHSVTQAVDLLLQHACEVADDEVRVGWADRGTHVAVEVRYTARDAHLQSSVVVAQVAELAASVGGRLATVSEPQDGGDCTEVGDRVRLVLMLPAAEPEQRIA